MKKSIFITGVTSGIGSEVLKHCLDNNFHVTAVIRKEEQKDLFKNYNSNNLTLLTADLSNKNEVGNLVNEIKSKTYHYALLNAGTAEIGTFHLLDKNSIDTILQTNLLSNMHITHSLLTQGIRNQTKFIFVSSLSTHLPSSNYISYGVSKAALSKFAQGLRAEYKRLPVLCVEIGAVDTLLHFKTNNINSNKKNFRSQKEIGEKLFNAILNKTGIVTLNPTWTAIRKLALLTDDMLTKMTMKSKR